jgi:uncharacterized protein
MESCWWRRQGAGLRLAVRIAAAPVEHAANARLCRYVAGLFDVPVGAVRLLQGNKSRDKLLAVDGVQTLPPALAELTGPEA